MRALFIGFLFHVALFADTLPEFVPMNEEFKVRWETFAEGRTFAPFYEGKSDKEIETEFSKLHKTRLNIWNTPSYERAQWLIDEDHIRVPICAAFAFNNAYPLYNSSTIRLANRTTIACEGPRSKDVPHFFDMCKHCSVTHLVRLTGSFDGWTKKCHSYWEDRIEIASDCAKMNIGTCEDSHLIKVYHMDRWRDLDGVDPEELLDLVLEVRRSLAQTGGNLAVHCSAGVGRTGTFLAALAIVDTIDQHLPLSIEEIVYQISLQRVYSVTKLKQYATLYRLAEAYLKRG